MATTIRLKRVGRKKQAHFRIVVTDGRTGPRGRSIERLGIYNPRTDPSLVKIDVARTLHWLHEGAKPSHSVRSLLREAGVWEKWSAGVTAAELEEPVVVLGPPPGRRTTSQRPAPDVAAEQAASAAAAREASAEATEEAPEAEAEEAPEAEAEEAPEAEAEESPEAEAEEEAEVDEGAGEEAEDEEEPEEDKGA